MSSNEKMVMVPREPTDEMIVAFAEAWYSKRQCIDDPDMLDAYAAMLAVAPEHLVEPVALPGRKDEMTADWKVDRGAQQWNACLDEIAKLGPLYSRPVQGEPVALLDSPRCGASWPQFESVCGKTQKGKSTWQCGECARKEAAAVRVEMEKYFGLYKEADTHVAHWQQQERVKARWAKQVEAERDTLRAQAAEIHKLLKWFASCADVRQVGAVAMQQVAALSANAEPSKIGNPELSESAEPNAPKCKGWTCFHCEEHFTDSEAAAIHFGTHEIQRPACLIDAAEYRSMEARVRECANEDSELHRQMHRQANEHKLELRRAEESGYAKGIAYAGAEPSAPIKMEPLGQPFAQILAENVEGLMLKASTPKCQDGGMCEGSSHKCDSCAPVERDEQAPCLNDWFLSLEPGRQAVLREDKWMLANAAFEAGLARAALERQS